MQRKKKTKIKQKRVNIVQKGEMPGSVDKDGPKSEARKVVFKEQEAESSKQTKRVNKKEVKKKNQSLEVRIHHTGQESSCLRINVAEYILDS